MQLQLKSFSQLVQDMAAALQGSASALIDVSVGSVVRAILEANAGVVLWMQWLLLQVLSMSRAATSVGSDLDTWMADFGLARLPATAASGMVTLSRYSVTAPASVPAGTQLKTTDGSLSFIIAASPDLSTWQQGTSAYVIPNGVSSIDLPATCVTAGLGGNVLANTISVIASSVPGVDQVSNAEPFTNGLDTETDAAFRMRFRAYISSLSKATVEAVAAAISSVQQGIVYQIKENVLPNGATRMGSFLVTIDDGSGYPSSGLQSAVASAVDAVRPVGTAFSVTGPTVQTVDVSVAIQMAASSGVPVIPDVQQAIAAYINGLPIEGTASVTRVAQSAYNSDARIDNVMGVTLNNAAVDIVAGSGGVLKAGQIEVTARAG
jgi:uncharacterized phage protein gp47/JayE